MAFEVITRSDITQVKWDKLVCGSPDGWVFSLWGWQELILAVPRWGLEDYSFGVMSAGQLIAVVPLQYNPSAAALMSSGWSGSGPILKAGISAKQRTSTLRYIVDHCERLARACGASKVIYAVSPVTQTSLCQSWGVNWFEMLGMRDTSRLSQVIDLSQTENQLWSNLSNLAKRKIKKSKKHGYYVERVNWLDHVEKYYEIHTQTYQRTGVVPHPKEYFAGIASNLANDGYSILFRALDSEGNTCAFHNMARFQEGAYYHTGCSTPTAAEAGGNYMLFWNAMLEAKKIGVRWFDAGWIFPHGASEKQKGLTHFKTRFGGQVHRSFFAELDLPPSDCNPLAGPPVPNPFTRMMEKLLGK
ncbi:hypothetical protein TRICHSKD4_0593 [Roseibium sp. TrichSKD4]|uniref:lipid II:glycine glycyltransferase FemX n=1 Tax=Roseibium sp. TrichSKD4 TaxID=744980 RepID=UPI0001E56589|nr:peptidoglycan bridge formation glycyltransferase FemA/FemB family protein [Roseibium sp. TrichSKD4]EFO33989.1 hypothetical protein TRICHSKD4_0593 [Roseibium sp. TrichSKD4]